MTCACVVYTNLFIIYNILLCYQKLQSSGLQLIFKLFRFSFMFLELFSVCVGISPRPYFAVSVIIFHFNHIKDF